MVDRDGDVDLVMAESVPGELRLVLNGGNGAFTAAPAGRLAATFRDLMVADFRFVRCRRRRRSRPGADRRRQPAWLPVRPVGAGAGALQRRHRDLRGDRLARDRRHRRARGRPRLRSRPGCRPAAAVRDQGVVVPQRTVRGASSRSPRRCCPAWHPLRSPRSATSTATACRTCSSAATRSCRRCRGQLWFGTAAGGFVNVSSTKLPVYAARTRAVEAGDIDADGDIDLLLGNNPGPNLLLVNDGQGGFTSAPNLGGVPHATLASYGGAQLVDLDGDGDLDYLNVRQSDLQLFENDGSGQFSLRATLSGLSSSAVRVARAGDFDGKRAGGLVRRLPQTTSAASGSPSRRGTSSAASCPRSGPASAAPTSRCSTWTAMPTSTSPSPATSAARLFENTGLGSFVDATAKWFDQRYCGGLAVADLDRDGDLDLVTTGNDTLLWFNRHRQHNRTRTCRSRPRATGSSSPAGPATWLRRPLPCWRSAPARSTCRGRASARSVWTRAAWSCSGAFSLPAPGGTADVRSRGCQPAFAARAAMVESGAVPRRHPAAGRHRKPTASAERASVRDRAAAGNWAASWRRSAALLACAVGRQPIP